MNHHGPIVGIFGGCHRAPGPVGAAIMLFTTWFWRWTKPLEVSTHSSFGFLYADGYREIFEAREGKSWQGPIPVDKVTDWVARDPKRRRFTMYDIPEYRVSQESMCRKRLRCDDMLEVWTYSMKQLPRMGVRKYLPFLPMKPTPNAVVCSEAASIMLQPEVSVCQLTGVPSPDQVTPYDFERAMKLLTSKAGHPPADIEDAYNG